MEMVPAECETITLGFPASKESSVKPIEVKRNRSFARLSGSLNHKAASGQPKANHAIGAQFGQFFFTQNGRVYAIF